MIHMVSNFNKQQNSLGDKINYTQRAIIRWIMCLFRGESSILASGKENVDLDNYM